MGLFLVLAIILGLIVLSLLVVIGLFIFYYNRFVSLNNSAQSIFHQIQVAMKKRSDMIRQLVDVTKGYIKYEKDVMTKVTQLRSSVRVLNTADQIKKANTLMTSLLSNLYATFENYPDLKASQEVQQLMQQISDVENEIARLRYTYNNVVQTFNTLCDTIPSSFVAALAGFKHLDYLEFGEELDRTPDTRVY